MVVVFLGLNLVLVGVWLLFHELHPALAPFDMAKWLPFLQTHVGKSFVFQFVAFLSTGSYFGDVWNSFAFWWQLGVAGAYMYCHVASTHRVDTESSHDSLLLHDYQKLDVQAM
ncbi:hypothetical protein DYB25_001692 [Aphanomyces astaci]|uniref:Uncharacterized protein n=1 Tax=Aphanomyces astaci TaxID=112090 RepID=A0A397B7E3_APHAT|nr:hypothetical protein DYB25_001692 [Aphanomyces astaci]RHY35792.1 hypothetical protein DYB34_001677 [Aphanomyces astaci]RHY49088.1 hypothetical protein DYB38_005802 [Aphanomyces astaci]RHY56975.1 hypothetical protein DYB30_005281 [Aphanomyces astaci]RHY79869.1 hypothetical protein DYB26_005293 [Aphanomyces astaci]